jgi:hypothetical protein
VFFLAAHRNHLLLFAQLEKALGANGLGVFALRFPAVATRFALFDQQSKSSNNGRIRAK